MRKIIVVPAVFIGCLIVIWVGTVAATHMPAPALLAPTLTAISAEAEAAHLSDSDRSETPPTPSSVCTLPTSYPAAILQWCSQIESTAQEHGLPASLIAAVILQESGGDAAIYSSSGAVGLMQVMPRDGIAADVMCVNGPCFAGRPTIAELEDPTFNIQYGTQYLAGLTQKHGSFREALFKYGPMDMGYRYADLVLKIWENYQ